MEILTPISSSVITPQSKKETIFDLSGQGISVLKKDDFNGYDKESTLNLSRNCFHLVPKWISELPITKLIISDCAPKFDLSFEAGFRKDVVVEAYGMGLEHPPENLDSRQVKCETDFASHKYFEQFAQAGFIYL